MLLEAVQKPQKVPRSLSAYHEVRKRAHAGAPSPYAKHLTASAERHRISLTECQDMSSHPSACNAHIVLWYCMPLYRQSKARHLQHDTCSSNGRHAPKVHLQNAIESPEGQQQRVGAAHAKGDVD